MNLFEIKTVLPEIAEPDIFITGWNRQLQRNADVEVFSRFFPSELKVPILLSGNVSTKVPVSSRSWFFYEDSKTDKPKGSDEDKFLTAPPSNSGSGLPDEEVLNKPDIDQLTRIRVPRDAIKIQDRLSYILQPPIESILLQPTLDLPFEPFPYQRQGIAFLYSAHFAVLADEMGLGKTMQAITTIRLLLHTGEVRSVLLVCPKPLISNWKREFELWAPEITIHQIDGSPARRKWLWQLPNIPVRLANYELLNRDREFFDTPPGEPCPQFDLVVLDESQKIKNKNNATSQAARAIARRRNWALTGTPVENSQEDLVGIFEFLSPGYLESGLKPSEMSRIVGDHILRRTKDNVKIQIPPILFRDALLDLTQQQEITYKMAEDEGVLRLSEAGESVSIPQVLELVMRLKQICNFDPATGESAKLQQLSAELEEVAASGKKAIVFSQWTETLFRLKGELDRFGIAEYHGKIPYKKRDDMIKTFREDKDIHVILMTYGAGGVGLNLQFSEYVFLFDLWWNPATLAQAVNRAHRIGSVGPVTVTRFISTGTIEERINRILEEKRQLAETILSGAQGLSSTDKWNADEIFGLLNLRVPSKLKKAA
ncbi:helicase [Planctomycetales bacterium]|nr:helicase [Planctomycetales bacterium]